MSMQQGIYSTYGVNLMSMQQGIYSTYGVNLMSMQQGIKKLQWFEYLKGAFLEILNTLLCQVFANQVTFIMYKYKSWNHV